MKYLLITILVVVAAGTIEARQTRPNDFAYGITISITGKEALNEFPIPDQVYRGAVQANLGDTCIFNAENEVVPFTLRNTAPVAPELPKSSTLPFFPLREKPERKDGELSLRVQRGVNGSIISVETTDTGTPGQIVTGYLLDASSLQKPVSFFSLAWERKPDGTIARIRVEGSNDLQGWVTLVPSATVISLRYGEHVLEQTAVELGGTRMKYYRLTTVQAAPMPKLTKVAATLRAPGQEQPRCWAAFNASPDQGKPGEYRFNLGGHMPVDRIKVRLPQENTLATATLYSRQTERDPWRYNARMLVYRLRIGGKELTSPEVILAPSSDPYRLLRIDTTGGGIGTGKPVVECGWIPGTVLFVARGSGPFLLAYGNGRNSLCSRGSDELFNRFTGSADHRVSAQAATGPQFLLGGERALHTPLIPTDWKTTMLWSTLLLGVAILAWMAYKLSRQMLTTNKNNGSAPGEDHTQ